MKRLISRNRIYDFLHGLECTFHGVEYTFQPMEYKIYQASQGNKGCMWYKCFYEYRCPQFSLIAL